MSRQNHLKLVKSGQAYPRTHWALRSGAVLILLGLLTLGALTIVELALKSAFASQHFLP